MSFLHKSTSCNVFCLVWARFWHRHVHCTKIALSSILQVLPIILTTGTAKYYIHMQSSPWSTCQFLLIRFKLKCSFAKKINVHWLAYVFYLHLKMSDVLQGLIDRIPNWNTMIIMHSHLIKNSILSWLKYTLYGLGLIWLPGW